MIFEVIFQILVLFKRDFFFSPHVSVFHLCLDGFQIQCGHIDSDGTHDQVQRDYEAIFIFLAQQNAFYAF